MKSFASLAALVLVVVVVVSCSKDKFETKPRLEINEYTAEVVPGSIMRFRFTFYDKEGDIGESNIVAIKERLNVAPPVPPTEFKADRFDYRLLEFPDKSEGEITFDLDYAFIDESPVFNDSIRFQFFLIDRAGNSSDTITSETVVARQQ